MCKQNDSLNGNRSVRHSPKLFHSFSCTHTHVPIDCSGLCFRCCCLFFFFITIAFRFVYCWYLLCSALCQIAQVLLWHNKPKMQITPSHWRCCFMFFSVANNKFMQMHVNDQAKINQNISKCTFLLSLLSQRLSLFRIILKKKGKRDLYMKIPFSANLVIFKIK